MLFGNTQLILINVFRKGGLILYTLDTSITDVNLGDKHVIYLLPHTTTGSYDADGSGERRWVH